MKIAVLAKSQNNAVWFYRVLPWLYMGRQFVDIDARVVHHGNMQAFEAMIPSFDVLVIHSPNTDQDLRAIHLAKAYNVRIVVDYDDLIFQVPNVNPAHQHHGKPEIMENALNCYKLADQVTVSTDALADYIEQTFNKRPEVVNNAHNDFIFPSFPAKMNEPQNGVNIVLWRGSSTHQGDMMAYRDAFQEFDNIEYHFWGMAPDLFVGKQYGGHLESWLYKPTEQGIPRYFQNLSLLKPNFLVVPLENTVFNRCKSGIAWFEATRAGAVCLASCLPEFDKKGVVSFRQPFELESLLATVDENSEDFSGFYLESVANIQENYLLSKINHKRALALEKMYQ